MANGEILKNVKELKYLGIWLNERLSWKRYIQRIIGKITPVAGL